MDCPATWLVEVGSLRRAHRPLVCLISVASLLRGLGGGIYLKGHGRTPTGSFKLHCPRMQDCTRGVAGNWFVTQLRSYRCDLHGFVHHLLLVLFYVFSQSEKDIRFSIGDHFVIKISAKQYSEVFS